MMLNPKHPERLLYIAIAMMIFGCVMPFLMVIKVVESTYFINFLSYILSVLGLFLGIIGIATAYRGKIKRRPDDEYDDRYK